MFSSITATDFYKTGHGKMLDKGTSVIYSNFTPRSAHLAPVLKESFDNKVVWFGLQAEIKDFLIKEFAESFFKMDCESAVKKYKRRIVNALGGDFDASHIRELHSLGYLPLSIKSLPEGSRVNIKVPCFTITNTNPGFAWLVNYVETVLSCDLWKPTTTATVAFEYKKILTKWAKLTGTSEEFVGIQGHDFSFRGMSGREDARRSGMGHLTSFVGTDTVTAIDAAEEWYNADSLHPPNHRRPSLRFPSSADNRLRLLVARPISSTTVMVTALNTNERDRQALQIMPSHHVCQFCDKCSNF